MALYISPHVILGWLGFLRGTDQQFHMIMEADNSQASLWWAGSHLQLPGEWMVRFQQEERDHTLGQTDDTQCVPTGKTNPVSSFAPIFLILKSVVLG